MSAFGAAVVLTLIFVTMKLATVGAVAAWSWWWVLSPLWICALLAVLLFIGVVLIAARNPRSSGPPWRAGQRK